MSGNHFDQIAQELLKQKQLMDKIEAENRELRQQIVDLRSGRGIFVDIYGIRFALRDDSSLVQITPDASIPANTSTRTLTVETPVPAIEVAEITTQTQEQSVKEQVPQSNIDGDQTSTGGEPTFLEEIMMDEFANALTSPNAVWQDPAEKKQSKQQGKPQEPIDEKQKEALRRELMVSFLLE